MQKQFEIEVTAVELFRNSRVVSQNSNFNILFLVYFKKGRCSYHSCCKQCYRKTLRINFQYFLGYGSISLESVSIELNASHIPANVCLFLSEINVFSTFCSKKKSSNCCKSSMFENKKRNFPFFKFQCSLSLSKNTWRLQ